MNKTNLISFTILIISVAVSYRFGFVKAIKTNSIFKDQIIQETLDNNPLAQGFLKDCPYHVNGGIYTKYASLQNEVTIKGRPELIKNSEVIKTNEPFNLTEFEKELYTIPNLHSANKSWDETSFDVDDDGKKERIISANVAMNHTPHIALILKDENVIFKAEGANIWIEDDYQGRGFTLNETIDWNIGETKKTRYLPKDGGFIPVWTQKGCWVKFE